VGQWTGKMRLKKLPHYRATPYCERPPRRLYTVLFKPIFGHGGV